MVEISGSDCSPAGQRKRPAQPPQWAGEKTEEEGAPLGGVGQTRGRPLWGLLQRGFRRAVEQMKEEEMKTMYMSHGLQHQCHIVLASPVRHVTHDSQRRTFVVLDSANTLHLLTEAGACSGSVKGLAPMAGILYASRVDQFVTWEEGGLRVLDSHFHLLSQAQSTLPIRCSLYSEQLNRIVTAGDGNLTVWNFRYGFRSLQCQVSVSTGLRPSDVFVRLALDTRSSEPHCCFASCATGAATFDISRGNLLAFKTNLHSREITDLAYCEAIGCVVTASRDTTIKVWDKDWHIQIVFVGHTAPVIAVTVYPQRPLIFSASQDGTIRTWNLNTVDQVDQVDVLEPVEALETHTNLHIFSISGCTLNLWKINQLYSLYTVLGSPAKRLSCIDLGLAGGFPTRILCLCQDSMVQLLEAQSGAPVSLLSLEPPSQAQEVAYCLPRETLFVLLEQGHVLRVNTATNPMVIKKIFSGSFWESKACCLLLYSHMVEPDKAYDTWLEVAQSRGYRKKWQKATLKAQDRNRFLPILGHKNGSLSVLDWFSGRIQYTVEAHSSEPVTALAEYPTQTCVLSAGADLTVKMWRLFPYVEECLLLLLCFSCASPAWHMCFLEETLAVAFQDPETVTYSIVYYNLMEQTRLEHGPEDDAQDDITGLCCCPNLKLFASASRDGSVKIWDIGNRLLRHLKLNTIPESLAFANHKGDLLVGLEQHLYLIPHSEYLPSYYKMKLLCANFLEPLKDIPLPITASNFEMLVKENSRRLKQELPLKEARPFLSETRRMALKESKEVREVHARLKGLSQLGQRDLDLRLLREGKCNPAKRLLLTKEMREEAFEHYMRIFHEEQFRLEIPEEDPFDAEDVLEALSLMDPTSVTCGPAISHMFLGGFAKPRPLERDSLIFAVTPSLLYGSTSEVAQTLKPKRKVDVTSAPVQAKVEEPCSLERALPCPSRLAQEAPKTVRLATQSLLPSLGQTLEEAVLPARHVGRAKASSVLLVASQAPLTPSSFSDFSGSKKGDPQAASAGQEADAAGREPTPIPCIHSIASREPLPLHLSRESQKQLPSASRSLQSSFIIKGFFPERPASQQRLGSSAEFARQSSLLPRISSGFIPNSVVAQQLHSLDLLETETLLNVIESQKASECPSRAGIAWTFSRDMLPDEQPLPAAVPSSSRPWIAPASEEEVSSSQQSTSRVFLTQLDESQYPEPAKEMPKFILPFVNQPWFRKLFPQGLPPEMGLEEFLEKLQEQLLVCDFYTKAELVGTVALLQRQLKGKTRDRMQNTLIQVLNKDGDIPSLQEKSQRKFILAALRLLLNLDKDSQDLMVELMTFYLMAPASVRIDIKDMIKEVGLQDPYNYFFREMNSWPVGTEDSKQIVRLFSIQWLEEAIQVFQAHIAHLQEQEAMSRKRLSLQSRHKGRKRRKSPKKKRKDARKPAKTSHEAKEEAGRENDLEEQPGSEDSQAEEEADHEQQPVRPIEAIQYFTEKQREKELGQKKPEPAPSVVKLAPSVAKPAPSVAEPAHDTVLALPPLEKVQAVVRLGETNVMLRARIPECFYFPYVFPRYVMKGFVPFVKLPLPRINLQPFPPPSKTEEEEEKPKTFTALQQLVQKYFVPKLSYADNYP